MSRRGRFGMRRSRCTNPNCTSCQYAGMSRDRKFTDCEGNVVSVPQSVIIAALKRHH